jgi:hypothetical protein
MSNIPNLASQLLSLNEDRRSLVMKADFLKEQLHKALVAENVGQVIIPLGSEEEMVIRANLRFTVPFDKDGLVDELSDSGIEKADLTYAGLAELVKRGIAEPSQVEKYQSSNRCEFVTVRVRKAKKPKKARV